MSDMSGYRALFISEMGENLEALEDSISSLKRKPDDRELIDEIFRITHTIKGMAATMGYNITADLAHKMEDLMSRLRDGELMDGDMDLLVDGCDLLHELLEDIVNTGRDVSVDVSRVQEEYSARLTPRYPPSASNVPDSKAGPHASVELPPSGAGSPPPSPTYEKDKARRKAIYEIRIKISEKALLKDARAIMVAQRLGENAIIKSIDPPLERMDSESFDGNLSIVVETESGPEELRESLLSIREVELVDIREGAHPQESGVSSGKKHSSDFQSVSVSVSHLDRLQSIVEDLVVQKGRLNTIVSSLDSPNLEDIASNIDSLVSQLTAISTELRLVPANYMFRRFQRIVRSIAREQGKRVEFIIHGDDIEMDRPVLEVVGEAIIHLIKNSIDHGIEPPDMRRRKGKDEVGHISLTAVRERGYSLFIVEDDGNGIDADEVTRVAVEKGLITSEEASKLSREDKINLIFKPGFSTAKKVTSVSGRGVGMDVVVHTLERVGGTLEIETSPGHGTRITLKLPFTTAIMEAIVVQIGRNRYVLPLQALVSILSVRDVKVSGTLVTIGGREVVVYKGDFYPVVDAVSYLSPETADHEILLDDGYLVLLRHGNRLFSLPVTAILGKDDMVVKPVESLSESFGTFSTATVMVDGSVAFVIDFSLLLRWGGLDE